MIRAKLVTHLVRYIIDRERIAHGIRLTSYTLCLTSSARYTETCDPTAARAENMTDIIACGCDPRVYRGPVLGKHRASVGVCIRIVGGGACRRQSGAAYVVGAGRRIGREDDLVI